MNTYRKKGPDCPGLAKCKWMVCCLSDKLEGYCQSLDRSEHLIPRYEYPEKEWVTQMDHKNFNTKFGHTYDRILMISINLSNKKF